MVTPPPPRAACAKYWVHVEHTNLLRQSLVSKVVSWSQASPLQLLNKEPTVQHVPANKFPSYL